MTMPVAVRDTRDGTTFMVRVTPRASRTAIVGVAGEGRANTALIEFLSDLLETPRSAIEIAGGQHGRTKRIVVLGRSTTEVAAAIEKALAAAEKK